MPEIQHGYKVVSTCNPQGFICLGGEKLQSASAILKVEYKPGCWTEPKPGHGPLGVFREVEDARGYIDRCLGYPPYYIIFNCEFVEDTSADMFFTPCHEVETCTRKEHECISKTNGKCAITARPPEGIKNTFAKKVMITTPVK